MASGSILTKLSGLPYDVPQGRSHNMGKIFGKLAPRIGEDKKRPKFGAIFDNFLLWSRNSNSNIPSDSRYPKSERNVIDSDSSLVSGKSPANFGPQTKKVLLAKIEPPK